MTNLPDLTKIAGFYMGPDGYTWGRDFVSRDPGPSRGSLSIGCGYSFLLWGRLAYEPSLPNGRFEEILGSRFPGISSSTLSAAWSAASKTLPLMTRFYWGSLDFMWYPEACWSSDGFVTVQNLIDPKYPPMKIDEDGEVPHIQTIKAFVDGEPPAGRLTPLDVADQLEGHALAGLQNSGKLQPGSNTELRHTLGDIAAMGWLGRYYAEKIRGAVDLYRFRTSGRPEDLDNARRHLQQAASHWKQYAAIWSSQYVGQVLTRMGSVMVDIQAIQKTSTERFRRSAPGRPGELILAEDGVIGCHFLTPIVRSPFGVVASATAVGFRGPLPANRQHYGFRPIARRILPECRFALGTRVGPLKLKLCF